MRSYPPSQDLQIPHQQRPGLGAWRARCLSSDTEPVFPRLVSFPTYFADTTNLIQTRLTISEKYLYWAGRGMEDEGGQVGGHSYSDFNTLCVSDLL